MTVIIIVTVSIIIISSTIINTMAVNMNIEQINNQCNSCARQQTMSLTDTFFFFLPPVFLKCPCLSFSFVRRTAKKSS